MKAEESSAHMNRGNPKSRNRKTFGIIKCRNVLRKIETLLIFHNANATNVYCRSQQTRNLNEPLLTTFLKWAIPGLFFFIFVFSIQLAVNVQLIFAGDWIRTTDLWNRKRPLDQLSHNHFPINDFKD